MFCVGKLCEVSSFVQLCDILPQEYRNEFDVYGMWSTFELLSMWTKVAKRERDSTCE